MKKAISIILFCFIVFVGHAQNFKEWFQQKKTQKKYLLQQIMAYQLYLGHLKKGYNIIKSGSGVISTLKEQDLDQHKAKFERLKKASPAVRNNPKVTAILQLQEAILSIVQKTGGQVQTAVVLNAGERSYIKNVFQNLLDQCRENMNQLAFLITDGQVQLSDDERIQRIDALYADMQVKYTFVYSFSKESGILRLARSREAATLENRTFIHQQR